LTLAAGATALIARFRKRSFGFWSRLAAGQNGWAIFTVRDAVQGWLDDQVEDNCHGSFGAETRARCEKTPLPFMGSLRIEQVTAGTLFNYRAHVSGLKGRRGAFVQPTDRPHVPR